MLPHFFPKENIYDIKTAIIFQSINYYNNCAHIHISRFTDKQHEIHPIGVDFSSNRETDQTHNKADVEDAMHGAGKKLHQDDTTEFSVHA